jgi:hypothetical protein
MITISKKIEKFITDYKKQVEILDIQIKDLKVKVREDKSDTLYLIELKSKQAQRMSKYQSLVDFEVLLDY